MNDVIGIEFDVKTNTLTRALDNARDDISGFKKRIASDTALDLSINKAKIEQELKNVTRLMKEAQKRGDFDALISFGAQKNLLREQLTQSGRELRNFARTGEKDVSVLGKIFGSLEQKIQGVEVELIKMGRSEKEVSHLRNRMNELNEQFKAGKISSMQFGAEMGKLEKELNGVAKQSSGAFGSLKSGILTIAGGLGLFTGLSAVGSLIRQGVQDALALGNSINRVATVAGGSKEELNDLKKSIREISVESGLSSLALADTAFMLASAGVKLENIPFVLRQVSLSAVAAATDTSTMFTGLNSVIQGYGYTLENIGIISDKFFKANAQGTLTIEGLSNSIGTVVPIANSARVSLDELLAAYATLTGVTGNEDEVATQLKGAINAIIAPSTEARKVLDSLGVEYGRNAIQAKGLAGVLKDINEKAEGNPQLIKAMIPEVRALTAVLALGGEQAEKYAENLEGIKNSAGATELALKKYTESEEFQIAKSQRIWDNWVSKVSGVFVRFLAQIAITAQDIGNYFSQMWRYMSFISVTEGKNLMTIAKNVSYNIGQAFGSIGGLVYLGLKSALWPIQQFYNGVIGLHNLYLKATGKGDQVTKPLDLASSVMSAVGIPKPSFVDVTSGTQNVNYSQLLKNFVRDTSGKDQSTKYDTIASNQVLTEKKKVIDQEVEDLLNPKKDKGGGEKSKELKKQKEVLEQNKELLKERNEYEKKSKKLIDEQTEALKKNKIELDGIVEKIRERNRELTADIIDKNTSTDEKLAERRVEIMKEEEDIRKKISEADSSTNISELQSQLTKLAEERAIIESKVSSEILNQVESYSKLYEAQKIVIENEKEIAKIKEEQAINDALTRYGDTQKGVRVDTSGDTTKAYYTDENGNEVEVKDRSNISALIKGKDSFDENYAKKTQIIEEYNTKMVDITNESRDKMAEIEKKYYDKIGALANESAQQSEILFQEEMERLKQLREQAIATANAVASIRNQSSVSNVTNNLTTNNTTQNQTVQVKTVADVNTINKELGGKAKLSYLP